MDELISIIIPVYNTEVFLERCIESLCAQTYKNWEIILVNDGSTDSSGQLCDMYATKDCRIHVIHQKNLGVSSARNAGLEIANGEYITFVDSDDYVEVDMLQKLICFQKSSKAEIVSSIFRVENQKKIRQESVAKRLFNREDAISDMLCCKNITYSVGCKIFQRTVINGLRFQVEYSHNEDLLFCYQAILKSNCVAHIAESLYIYGNNENSATRIPFNKKRLTAIDVQEFILRDIQNRYPMSKLYQTAEQQFLKVNIYTAMQMASGGYEEKSDKRRVRKNVRKHFLKLVVGDLAIGYKLNGALLSVSQVLFDIKFRGEIRNK